MPEAKLNRAIMPKMTADVNFLLVSRWFDNSSNPKIDVVIERSNCIGGPQAQFSHWINENAISDIMGITRTNLGSEVSEIVLLS